MTTDAASKGLLLIVSGPAGSGKTTLCDRMLAEVPAVQRVITATTRRPRAGEANGVDYYFFDHPTFEGKIAAGDFFEYAQVHGNIYGVLKSEVLGKLHAGVDLLLNIDVQGAATFREARRTDPLLANCVASVFVMPPSIKELESRLRRRGTDADDEIARRLKVALEEIQHRNAYDYCIPSGSQEDDFAHLLAIYRAEKLRVR